MDRQAEALRTLQEMFGDRLRRSPRSSGEGRGALASLLPVHADEVRRLSGVAERHSLPLVAVGAGTAPEDPRAAGGGILVRFDLMRGMSLPHNGHGWVEAEPGVPWLNLDDELRTRGRGLAVYPTSAPRATVGGWLATDGVGIGSFEYGRLRENVLSARVVVPGGTVREVPGSQVHSFFEGDAAGIVVGARLRTRRADADLPFAAALPGPEGLLAAVSELARTSAPSGTWPSSRPRWRTRGASARGTCSSEPTPAGGARRPPPASGTRCTREKERCCPPPRPTGPGARGSTPSPRPARPRRSGAASCRSRGSKGRSPGRKSGRCKAPSPAPARCCSWPSTGRRGR